MNVDINHDVKRLRDAPLNARVFFSNGFFLKIVRKLSILPHLPDIFDSSAVVCGKLVLLMIYFVLEVVAQFE